MIGSDDAAEDYVDWSIGISREILGFNLSLAYVDSDLSNLDIADERVIFTVAKSF